MVHGCNNMTQTTTTTTLKGQNRMIESIGQIAITTSDIQNSLDFYNNTLGFKLLF